uniref:Uncharacterized protein n=1 Tax=Megaselia scalaris TaxID=36166 RepID=T1GGL1_MEGSC
MDGSLYTFGSPPNTTVVNGIDISWIIIALVMIKAIISSVKTSYFLAIFSYDHSFNKIDDFTRNYQETFREGQHSMFYALKIAL